MLSIRDEALFLQNLTLPELVRAKRRNRALSYVIMTCREVSYGQAGFISSIYISSIRP